MFSSKRLTQVFESAREIPFDDSSKFILFGDCHRGDNSLADDFVQNQNIFIYALKHYCENGFIYIELGDGDELWENKNYEDIIQAHNNVFRLMNIFYKEKRFHFVWGNHDIERKKTRHPDKLLYYEKEANKIEPLFDGIEAHEGLVLKHTATGNKIFLVHGHQGDLFNDRFWRLGRFFARHFWRHLQLFGVRDLTSPAKNYKKRIKVEKEIIEWVKANDQMLIAGHTHRPVFPSLNGPLYFNVGSCVHPRCITGIEIKDGLMGLVKWFVNTRDDGGLFIDRKELEEPRKLQDYFQHKGNKLR